MTLRAIKVCCIALAVVAVASLIAQKGAKLTFAAGFSGGTYFKIGKSISKISKLKMKVVETNGSGDNISRMKKGDAQFALVQIDVLTNSYMFDRAVKRDIKILLPVYKEEVHIVARKSVKKLTDLIGKKIGVGSPTSGTNVTAKMILGTAGIPKNPTIYEQVGTKQALPMLLKGELDAFFLVSGAPVELLTKIPAKEKKNIHLLSLEGKSYELLTGKYFPYEKTTLPAKIYPWLEKPANTMTAQSLLVGHAKLKNSDIKKLVQKIFSSKSKLIKSHPKWRQLDKEYTKAYLASDPHRFHSGAKSALK